MALKEGYKEIKVRLPMQELEVLNAKVAHSRMTREKYIRCLIAERPPIEYPPVDYRLIIRRVEELQDTLECLLQEDPEKRERAQMSLALENVSHTADMLRRVMLL